MAVYKLGPKAYMFYDPSTGLTLTQGETVEISDSQVLASSALNRAIQGGHLVLEQAPEAEDEEPQKSDEDLKGILEDLLKAGETKKAKKQFSLDVLKRIAALYNLEADENDTKDTLLQAIQSEIISETETVETE